MMMECPRCGFAQPKDQYCAKCGLDVDHYVVKPKPLWTRIAQNSNLHLSLIALLLALAIGFILYSQAALVGRRVEALFTGTPVSSREAGDPKGTANRSSEVPPTPVTAKVALPEPPVAPSEATPSNPEVKTEEPAKILEDQKLDVSAWEIPHEALANLLTTGEKVGENGAGRAYLFPQNAAELVKTLQASARRISHSRTMPLQMGAQLAVETPASASEAFQFGLYFSLTKVEPREVGLKWESTLVLPQSDAPSDAASTTPVVKALTESTLKGAASLNAGSALVILFDPTNRAPRAEYLTRAGDGPWTIFASEDFRTGVTDWLMLIQLK